MDKYLLWAIVGLILEVFILALIITGLLVWLFFIARPSDTLLTFIVSAGYGAATGRAVFHTVIQVRDLIEIIVEELT